jgi:isoleucyl-tRNA synthetase
VFARDQSKGSIFFETFSPLPSPNEALLAKWARIRAIRDVANKAIEDLRAEGQVGASLQATLTLTAGADDAALLRSLGADLRFVTITSAVTVIDGGELAVTVAPSSDTKCERCWHYVDDVGSHDSHPSLCRRCVSNLAEAAGTGTGETRSVA